MKHRVWPPLPMVPLARAIAINAYITKKYNPTRPPYVTAKVLGLVIELWSRSEPFPMREHVAVDLSCTKWGVDSVLRTALARGLVTVRVGTVSSILVTHRPAVHRYYIPSDELVLASGWTRRAA